MNELTIECGNCKGSLSVKLDSGPMHLVCPLCSTAIQVHAFAALAGDRPAAARPDRVMLEDESSCFYHVQNRAVVPCDQCGRFLCALCEIPDGSAHLCPACFSVKRAPQSGELPQRITRHDHVALSLAVVPLLFFPVTVVTAPLTLYLVFRAWGRRQGPIHSNRHTTLLLAALVAIAQIGMWMLFTSMMIYGFASAET